MIAVAEKVLRVEAFGIECAIFARDLSWQWVSDVRDLYSVGDRVLVRVQEISGEDVEHLSIRADIRSIFRNQRGQFEEVSGTEQSTPAR